MHHEPEPGLRRDGADRYGIYTVPPRDIPGRGQAQRELCATSKADVVGAIDQMVEEGEVPRGWRIGIFDKQERRWVVNPYA